MKTRTNQPVTDYEGIVEGLEEQASVSGIKIYEDIKDKDGHSRFVEGDIDLVEGAPEGLTKTYGKWALSGSHLLIVLGVEVANTTALTGAIWAYVNMPEWVIDKIVPLFNNRIDYKQGILYADDQTTQSCYYGLIKDTNKITIRYLSNTTLTADRTLRMSFDLLIDNE